jgi:uncharacterized protein YrrD
MFRKAKELKGFRLGARDGEIGRVKDFYFDDETWMVRYLVADTGMWMPGRQVLISPHAIKRVHPAPEKAVEVDLTKRQIEESPSIETDKPVSRQFEIEYFRYYDWPIYWGGPLTWDPIPCPGLFEPGTLAPAAAPSTPPPSNRAGNPHLRSVADVSCYSIQTLTEQFGHVADFLLDDEAWAIRYLVVDTRNWWPGKKVLLAPEWIAWVSWAEARVYIDLDLDTVKRAPEYDASAPITRQYEAELFDHYGRTPYWEKTAGRLAA